MLSRLGVDDDLYYAQCVMFFFSHEKGTGLSFTAVVIVFCQYDFYEPSFSVDFPIREGCAVRSHLLSVSLGTIARVCERDLLRTSLSVQMHSTRRTIPARLDMLNTLPSLVSDTHNHLLPGLLDVILVLAFAISVLRWPLSLQETPPLFIKCLASQRFSAS